MTTPSNFIQLLGRELRFIREEKGFSQEKVAEIAGIAHARISDIETGKLNPTLATIEKVIDALDITPQEIFNFGRLNSAADITDKKALIEVHRSALLKRDIDEVKYVVNTTSELLKIIDKK